MQTDFFESNKKNSENSPLAHKARPNEFNFYFGQDQIFKKYPYLKGHSIPSLIIYGPPGCGKTTLVHLLAKHNNSNIHFLNAVLSGVSDLKKTIKHIQEENFSSNKKQIIFLDEIHRFNKTQQDALLPYVEDGTFTLIGATTENPKTSLNKALLSRVKLVKLEKLDQQAVVKLLKNANEKFDININDDILNEISKSSSGDARFALNILEQVSLFKEANPKLNINLKIVNELILEKNRLYDKNADRHYDVISAFIKSMRAGDEKGSILWLAVMLDGGEDPVFIARRLIIFASEDIGIANPHALPLATATLSAIQNIGMPEARINLAHATSFMARSTKSRYSYELINNALNFVKANETIEVPKHLKNN